MDHLELLVEKHDKRCNFLFVGEVEGKSWVMPQLQAGAKGAEKVVPKNEKVRFLLVATYGRIRKYERNLLQEEKNKIRFRGMREPILLIKCESSLAQAIR